MRIIPAISGLIILLITGSVQARTEPFTLASPDTRATILLPESEPEYVRLAVQDLVSDVQRISGQTLPVVNRLADCAGNCVIVGTAENNSSAGILTQFVPQDLNAVRGKWEAYRVKTVPRRIQPVRQALVIMGSNARGTMFGVYDFIEQYLGVDPMHYWSDMPPAPKTTLRWPEVTIVQDEPAFRYRGWFINDEDLLTEWIAGGGKRNIDYPFYGQVVSPEAIRPVFEAMVRLRYNLAIPASFIDIRNPAEARLVEEAVKRGLFVSMHHVEPMGVSAFTFFNYWQEKNGTKPLFSFYSSRREVEEVWRLYAREWAKFGDQVIWQIGLRGIADRPMWMADPGIPQTDADRGKLISEAMRVQMDLIREVDKRPAPVVTTTLWAEGAGLNQDGHLTFPPEAVIIFADNSPGWKWQADFYETKREENRRYGVYYHHQLWGSGPHLAQAVPPQQTYRVMQEAVTGQADHYAIFNVSNVREFLLGVDATARMLYNFGTFNPDQFLAQWCRQRFGKAALLARQAYEQYFSSYALHSRQNVPLLLDGQTRAFGRDLLNQLSSQITDPVDYLAAQRKKNAESVEATWVQRSLADMHPKEENLEALRSKVESQRRGLEKTGELAAQALAQMTPAEQAFFQTNLIVHQQIILALTRWLDEVIAAKQAEEAQDRSAVISHLERATAHFHQIHEAKNLGSRSEKWQHWYRGDKKMNLEEVEKLTARVLQQASDHR